jgi:molybdate transport system substrate-binding protein
LALATSMALSACAPTGAGPDDDASGELTIFAASSLRDVAVRLEEAWSQEMPDVTLFMSFGGSNVLAAQIRERAPADVFMSADVALPRALVAEGVVVGDPFPFAVNHIILVAALDAQGITEAIDIAAGGTRLIAAGKGVPISRYADEVLAQLADTTQDPSAFLSSVETNIASREDNVRAALAKVRLGEGDAAFVYDTDVQTTGRVRRIPLPATVGVNAVYSVVQVSDASASSEFVAWLGGTEAMAILADAGFTPIGP